MTIDSRAEADQAQTEGWAEQLGYLQLEADALENLRRVRPVVIAALPEVLERFYRHTLKVPELAEKFPSPDTVGRAKAAQTAHWKLLFEGRFDQAYFDSVRRIGTAHYRIGLSPRWYIAGYSFIFSELLAAIAGRYGRLVQTPANRQRMVATQQAVARAIMLDMELAINTYWELTADERRGAVDSMIERIDQQVNETIQSVAHVGTDLVRSAEMMTCIALTVDVAAQNASEASQTALGSAQTVASAAEELHASIGEISGQVQRTAHTARDAACRMHEARSVVDRLGTAAEEIGQVVQIISSIAAQTNLLALNATIEAARAGEAGKGFAVVAGEVKNLANQSAGSAKNITERIAAIQQVAQSTVRVIDEVAGTIEAMEQGAATISAAIEEQTAATSEIARSIAETAEQAESVTTLMGQVSDHVDKANRASLAVGESSNRMEESLTSMRHLMTKAVRTSSAIANRRKLRRRATLVDAEILLRGNREQATVYDLSEQGCMAACSTACESGSPVTVSVPGDNIRLAGTVVANSGSHLHIRFEPHILPAQQADEVARRSVIRIVDLARSDHVAFVDKIAAALAGDHQMAPADLSTHHTCRLGRWYDAVTDDMMMSLPAFATLAEPHRDVHAAGRQVLVALDSSQTELARTRMAELRSASARVLDLLDQLRAQYLGKTDKR
jgi:methyl-accepting chemotaxis protein